MKERKGAEKRGGDRRCLDPVRWGLALFGLGQVEIGAVWTLRGGVRRCLDSERISESHMTQSAAMSAYMIDAGACFMCFALCFNFLSFDFFGANKRGREWWERHSVEGVKGRGTLLK
nr:hypothetical protein CFP56_14797 [Quercus suber]